MPVTHDFESSPHSNLIFSTFNGVPNEDAGVRRISAQQSMPDGGVVSLRLTADNRMIAGYCNRWVVGEILHTGGVWRLPEA
ncbi:MAG: hypothetical protein JWQ04_533 [Pedosphaera sp.]|nr:hypothetical protein [Pedosphaera sp.]